MGKRGEARFAAALGEVAAIQAVNQNLLHATHVQSQKDFDSFDKISNHTPVIYYIWSPSSPPCRYVGQILDQAVGAAGGSVLLVAYEIPDSKQLKELKKGGGDVPYASVMWKGEIQWGYGINGGKGDDQAQIMIQRDQLPPGDFRNSFASSGGFYVDLLSSKEGPERVKDVVVFALSLAMVDIARATPSLEKRLGVKVRGYEIKPGANLPRVDLSGADLSGAALRKANLSDSDLSAADLSGADLSKVFLTKTNLSGADLSGADLCDAFLAKANLSGANLSGANLSGADFRKANLEKSNLSGADLSGANLSQVLYGEKAVFFEAKADSATIWWDGFNPGVAGVVFASSESSSPEAKSSADSMNTDRVKQPSSADPLDQLAKLGELHAAGTLSDEEFAAKKAELLDRI